MSAAYEAFRVLHEAPGAFIMPNPWDGASALLLQRAGFAALASTSLGIAFAAGRPDLSYLHPGRWRPVTGRRGLAEITGWPARLYRHRDTGRAH